MPSEISLYFYHFEAIAMQTIAKQVLDHAAGLPGGTPLVAKELLHLGSLASVDQVLSHLVRRSTLLRAGRGIYVLMSSRTTIAQRTSMLEIAVKVGSHA
jgi:hypothetical protein